MRELQRNPCPRLAELGIRYLAVHLNRAESMRWESRGARWADYRLPGLISIAPRLAHTDTGTGPPVVLLHGLTCHLGYWLRVVPLLEGVRVVALDFRGHGLSGHADAYGYADYERDLLSLLERLELGQATLAGHSLGGYVALLAASRSDRIGRVVAIDVKSDWTDDDAAFAERSRDGSQRVETEREVLIGRLAKSVAPAVLDPDELELVAERSLEPVEGGWRFRWDRRVLDTEPVDPFAVPARRTRARRTSWPAR